MRLRLHPEAAIEATATAEWYDGESAGLGVVFLEELDRGLNSILEAPFTWPLWPEVPEELGVRRFLLDRFPFGVAYQVKTGEIQVIAVAHLKRRQGYWASRT